MARPLANPTFEAIAKDLAEMVIDGKLTIRDLDFVTFDCNDVELPIEEEEMIRIRTQEMVYELTYILINRLPLKTEAPNPISWVQVLDPARRH